MAADDPKSEKTYPDRWTIIKVLSWTEGYFKSFNIDSPRFTAEILLSHALNIKRLELYLQFDRPLNKSELAVYKSLIKRRAKREPAAYITGKRGFWDSDFIVTPDVLIPRPDTETLVETALNLINQKKDVQKQPPLNVLDLGTGSGAVVISLAKVNPDVMFYAVDISYKAVAVAKKNSISTQYLPPLNNISFITGSWFSPIKFETKFDIIVSNPPYIPTSDINNLQEEIKDYEPLSALDGGPEGISCLKEIMLSAPDYLESDGILIMEMGFDQKEKIERETLLIKKYEQPIFIKDYAGHDRVVILKKSV